MKKLFIFDIDGTLLNSQRVLVPSTTEVLRKAYELGNEIAIVSGRSFVQLDELLKSLPEIQYIGTLNGGVLTDLKECKEYIFSSPLNHQIVDYFIEVAQRIRREFQCSNNRDFYRIYFGNDPKKDITNPLFFKGGAKNVVYTPWEMVKDKIPTMDIYHMAIKCEPELLANELPVIRKLFDDTKKASISETSYCYIECDPLNISKVTAIQKIQELTGINNQQTYFFGDSGNDIKALNYVGNPVVMGNAKPEIKKYGKYVIGDNNSSAIHDFIMNVIAYD